MKSIKTRLAGWVASAALAVMAATLFAAQPMSWEEYLVLTRGPSPQDGIGRFRLEGVDKTVYYDAPHALEQGSACEIAVVLVHGWGGGIRRAAAMAPLMRALAKGTGQGVAPPYVVAPLFPRSDLLRGFGSAARDLAQWNASWKENNRSVRGKAQDDWRGGGDAVGTTLSSYDVIDRIFAVLGDRERYPNLRRVVLSGFSAGGQFAGRYAAVGKGKVREGVEVAYVAMAPSTELRLDPELAWRYGIKGRPRYSAALTEQEILANLSSRRVWRGCGTKDVLAKPHTALDSSPEAMSQGTNRIERFWSFKRYLKRFPSWEKQVSFHAFNGLGHNSLGAYSDPAVIDFVLHGDANIARERTAEVVIAYESGRRTSALVALAEKEKGLYEWRLPRADLNIREFGAVRSVRVLPDFAKARYGEDGWLMAADGTRGFFVPRESNIHRLRGASCQITPLYGMKTPRATFVALATGMKYHAGVSYVASNGWYSVAFDFHADMFDVYEDISVLYRVFDDPKADYNDMAHWYRDYQRANGRLTPLKERAAARPQLAYAARCPEIRIRQAWKPVPATVNRQVPENEPKITPYVTFRRVTELANRVHAAGVKGAEFCLVGWNKGGHDGAYPQLFPVEPILGGEESLRACIRDVQALGYKIVAHGNHNDAYMIADSFDLEFVREKDKNGLVVRPTETWGGGGKFTMCPQRAYEKFAIRDAARLSALGFDGLFYLDVLTCFVPGSCRDPRHPLTRAGMVKWFNAILDLYSDTFGGVSSEGACDAYAGHFDSVLTASWSDPFPKPDSELSPEKRKARRHSFFSDHVPFWELVYHGYLLYTPFRNIMNATANPDPRFRLKLAEYDGRPTFYVHSRFQTQPNASMGARDLRADTEDELAFSVECIRRGAEEYARRSDLQFTFMERHEKVAEGVFKTTFSNGAKICVNYCTEAKTVDGVAIPAMDYVVLR